MSRDAQRGFGASIAVALIAMVAILAGAALVLSASQQTGLALDVQSGRAYQAAKGGLEWGMNSVLRAGGACAGMTAGTTFSYGGKSRGIPRDRGLHPDE